MQSPGTARRLILRADLRRDDREDVAHTIEISESTVFVRTDEPADVGDRVSLRLSFPHLLAPLEIAADVVGKSAASEPGDVAGLTLEFVFASEEEKRRIDDLLARVDTTVGAKKGSGQERSFRLLLVEDSDFIRDMFTMGVVRHFRKRPAQVTLDVAVDCDAAWERLNEHEYEMAIVDYYLPNGQGSQLVTRIREDARLKGLPVVGISVGGAEAREAFLAAGADIFLDKPIVLRDLYSTIELLSLTRAAA